MEAQKKAHNKDQKAFKYKDVDQKAHNIGLEEGSPLKLAHKKALKTRVTRPPPPQTRRLPPTHNGFLPHPQPHPTLNKSEFLHNCRKPNSRQQQGWRIASTALHKQSQTMCWRMEGEGSNGDIVSMLDVPRILPKLQDSALSTFIPP